MVDPISTIMEYQCINSILDWKSTIFLPSLVRWETLFKSFNSGQDEKNVQQPIKKNTRQNIEH